MKTTVPRQLGIPPIKSPYINGVPSSSIRHYVDQYRKLQAQVDALNDAQLKLRHKIRTLCGVGSNYGVSVYRVRATTVNSYKRRGYTAMRIGRTAR